MGLWTIRLIRKVSPEKRLIIAAWLFWVSVVLAMFCTLFVAKGAFEQILMLISWLAITITCVDVILTADVRDSTESE